jgi:DNA-binding protein HU-beta
MKKADLITAIAEEASLTKTQAERALNALTKTMKREIITVGEFTLTGIAMFKVNEREARIARNPRTGEPVALAAKKIVKIKPVKRLSGAVN